MIPRIFGRHREPVEAPTPLPSDVPDLDRETAVAALAALQVELDHERASIYRAAGSRRWNVWIPTRLAPSTGGRRETVAEWCQQVGRNPLGARAAPRPGLRIRP